MIKGLVKGVPPASSWWPLWSWLISASVLFFFQLLVAWGWSFLSAFGVRKFVLLALGGTLLVVAGSFFSG